MQSNFKGYSDTYIFKKKNENGINAEYELVDFIKMSDRINKASDAFAYIKNQVKSRQTTAVLFRVLMMPNVVLCSNTKELPASFKVFYAKDLRADSKSKKVFIDCTNLIKLENGYYTCKEIDKLCAYLIMAINTLLYFESHDRLVTNSNIIKSAANCYTKLFDGVIDNLRVGNFRENKNKISYIVATYFLYQVVQKDYDSAKAMAANIVGLQPREASAYDLYYDINEDFVNLETFVRFLAQTFRFKDLTVDVFVNRWIYLYGSGTLYGLELLPNFLSIITNAYSGTYINNQRMIENICGKEIVTLSTSILRTGADEFDNGFRYESADQRHLYEDNELRCQDNKLSNRIIKK